MNRQIIFLLTALTTIPFSSLMLKAMDKPSVPNGAVASSKAEDHEQSLIDAIIKGDLEQAKQIFSHANIKPDAILKNKGTALMFAAAYGHEHIARYLVEEKRANANTYIEGLTPLMLAARGGYLGVVTYLINEARAHVSAIDSHGFSAFYLAVKKGQLNIVQHFVERPDFNPHIDGVVAMSLAHANNHPDIIQYLITRGIPALPNPQQISGMRSIFYDDKANEHIRLDSLEILAHDIRPISDSDSIPSMSHVSTLHTYQLKVLQQTAPDEPCIKEQLKMAVAKLGGTQEMHCNTSPIFGGTCAYHATKNALIGLMMLHDYDKVVENLRHGDDKEFKKSAQWLSADLESLKTLRTGHFDCERFMEQLHATTFMIQHEPWLKKHDPINIQQSFNYERMLIARHEVADAFSSIMAQRYHGSQGNYDNMVSFINYDIFPNFGYSFSSPKGDTAETVYQSKDLPTASKHLRSVDLLQQIALFRTNDTYRHAFVFSLNEDNLDGWGLSLDRTHAITMILDKRGSVINAIISESNNLPTYAIKKIVFDFLNFFTSNQTYCMGDEQRLNLVRCASNPLGCWVAKEQKGLPSFASLVEAYVQLRNQSFTDKKRDDIHYALFLLSEIQHVVDRVSKRAEKEECQAMQAILQSNGLFPQEKTMLRQEEIALYNKFQEVETEELNGRMHYFIQDGDIAKVKECLQIGANPNATHNDMTALGLAAELGHQDIVEYIVEKGADIDAKDNKGRTPLMLAAEGGHRAIIEYLITRGAHVNSQDNDGNTVLMHAAAGMIEDNKKLETIRFLIEHCKADTAIMNNQGQGILKVSAACFAVIVVKYLINECKIPVDLAALVNEAPVKIDGGIYQGFSLPLLDYCIKELGLTVKENPALVRKTFMAALKIGRPNEIKRLFESDCGLDVHSKDEHGMTALMHAVAYDNLDLVKFLIEKRGVNPRVSNNGQTAFTIAIQKGDTRFIDYFIKNCGFNIEDTDQNGFTALLCAAARSDVWTLESLIENYHANMHATDKDGRTALMLASGRHVDTLTCHAAACSTEKKKGRFDMMFGSSGHLDAVSYLVEHGCDMHAIDKHGNTALRHAQLADRENVIHYLTK